MIFTIAAFVVALAVLVVIHELGHFFAAKRIGVKVERFSVGFGPIVARRQVGETEYALSAIPLGGYVKMLGEDDDVAEEDRARSFSAQSVSRRTAIVAAGPIMNLVFALVAYVVLAAAYGLEVPSTDPIVGIVSDPSPAREAGLETGDRVLAIDGDPVETWEGLSERVRASDGRTLALTFERDGASRTIDVTPELRETQTLFGEEQRVYLIGVGLAYDHHEVGLGGALLAGIERTAVTSWMVTKGFVLMFVGRVPLRELGGPIAIAQAAGEQARAGLEPFLAMLAFLSVNLGVLNVLPIPVLDGGHLAIFGVEAIMRRRLRPRVREMAQQVGLLVLVSLMVFVLFNDVTRLVQG
jgi:regulator of sigma E protease